MEEMKLKKRKELTKQSITVRMRKDKYEEIAFLAMLTGEKKGNIIDMLLAYALARVVVQGDQRKSDKIAFSESEGETNAEN